MDNLFVGTAEDQLKRAEWQRLKQLDHDGNGKPGGSKKRKANG